MDPYSYNPYSYEAQNYKQGIQDRDEARRRSNQRLNTYDGSLLRPQHKSRQKETEALAMLNDFQRAVNGGESDPLNMFGAGAADFMRTTKREKSLFQNIPQNQPPSRGNPSFNVNPNHRQSIDQGGAYGYNQGPNNNYQSPFQNAANMMMNNPMSPYQMPMQGFDPYGNPIMGSPTFPEKKKESNKAAEILMASLEKQNMILSELTGSIQRDRENKVLQESREIEYRIKQLEYESGQFRPNGLLGGQNNYGPMGNMNNNFNGGFPQENGVQKYNSLLPGIAPNVMSPAQMMQLSAIMQQQRFMPFGAPMGNDMFKHQMKFLKKFEKQKKRDKEEKKKNKLNQLLKLLGEEDGTDEEDVVIQKSPRASPSERRSSGGSVKAKTKDTKEKKALAAQVAQLEAEKVQQAENLKKKKNKWRTQAILWTRLYPALFLNDFKKRKGDLRADVYSQLSQRIGVNIDNTKNWVTKAAAKGFEQLVSNTKLNITLVPYAGKKLTPKDLEPRPQDIQKILKVFMDGFINNTRREIVPSQLLSFLGDITQNYQYPPQNYLFAFELNRLSFTHNGALKDMGQPKVQMICAFFIFIRVFIAEMLLQTDKVVPTVKMTDTFVRNIKTMASILVIVMVEFLRSKVVVQNGNQNHLDVELKLKPRSGPIQFNSPVDLKDDQNEEEGATGKKPDPTEIVISNLYTKEQLAPYFSKKPLVDELKALLEGWCNAISEIVTSHHQDEVKEKMGKK